MIFLDLVLIGMKTTMMYHKSSPNIEFLTLNEIPTFVPKLCHRFPERYETESIEHGFDQSPVLKEIADHYNKRNKKPSAQIVSELSPKDNLYNCMNPLKNRATYSQLLPSIVSVSYFFGLPRKIDCSGLIIEWDSIKKEAIILTSAKLLWSRVQKCREEHIIIRLFDGTLLLGKEDYVDYYHNLLTLKVKSTTELKFVDLRSKQVVCEDLSDGMSVISLGREFYSCCLLNRPGELYLQYPYFGCEALLTSTCHAPVASEGGPLITDSGYVVGINFVDDYGFGHPLPIPIILASLDLWREYRTVVRPWFGFSAVGLNQLPPHVWEIYNILPGDSYVVVKEVYEGSHAYEKGVRPGDIIAACNGIAIHSAKQYSQLLFDRSRIVTSGVDSKMASQSFKAVIQSVEDGATREGEISIEGDDVAVVDKRFCQCWPHLEGQEWVSKKVGSQANEIRDFVMEFGNIPRYLD